MASSQPSLASVVIVGGGHAGFTVASELRTAGFQGAVTLFDEAEDLPYQRPPLSKAYLNDDIAADELPFRGEAFYRKERIDLRRGESVTRIDRADRRVVTSANQSLQYDALVLATGAVSIRPPWVNTDLIGMIELRTKADADRLIRAMGRVKRLVIVGGGFIGLEVAYAARKHDLSVDVIEMQDRLMARAVGETLSQYSLEALRSLGIRVHLEARVCTAESREGRVFGVTLSSGELIASDVVVVGLGVRPRTELAEAAGLDVSNGIVVNDFLQTSDPSIFAIGDCCSFPYPFDDTQIRLESVQNATDQARSVAKTLTDRPEPYSVLPWFWSNQGGMKLQMAGYSSEADREVMLGDSSSGRFSILRFAGDRLVCAESVNNTGDHVSLRTIVAHGADRAVMDELSKDQPPQLRALARSLRAQSKLAESTVPDVSMKAE